MGGGGLGKDIFQIWNVKFAFFRGYYEKF